MLINKSEKWPNIHRMNVAKLKTIKPIRKSVTNVREKENFMKNKGY